MFAMFLFVSYYMQQVLSLLGCQSRRAFLPFALGVIVPPGWRPHSYRRSGLAS